MADSDDVLVPPGARVLRRAGTTLVHAPPVPPPAAAAPARHSVQPTAAVRGGQAEPQRTSAPTGLHPVQPTHAFSSASERERSVAPRRATIPSTANRAAAFHETARAHPTAALTELAHRNGGVVVEPTHHSDAALHPGHRPQRVLSNAATPRTTNAANTTRRSTSKKPGYVNPFRLSRNVVQGRIDQGVDFHGTGPIVSPGNAVVVGNSGSGWPGGPGKTHGNYLLLRLTSGPDAGRYIYIAEGITPTVRAGQRVRAGQVIGHFSPNAAPGRFPGIEIGWGSRTLNLTQAAATTGYVEGEQTPSGRNFADFLETVGAYRPHQ